MNLLLKLVVAVHYLAAKAMAGGMVRRLHFLVFSVKLK